MEELKFLSAAVLALILAVPARMKMIPPPVTVRCTAALLFMNGGWTRFRCIP